MGRGRICPHFSQEKTKIQSIHTYVHKCKKWEISRGFPEGQSMTTEAVPHWRSFVQLQWGNVTSPSDPSEGLTLRLLIVSHFLHLAFQQEDTKRRQSCGRRNRTGVTAVGDDIVCCSFHGCLDRQLVHTLHGNYQTQAKGVSIWNVDCPQDQGETGS